MARASVRCSTICSTVAFCATTIGLPLSINSHTYVAETSQQAAREFFPPYAAMMNAIGRERGWSGIGEREFEALRSPRGALVVGSPQEVIEKILFQHEIFGHDRFLVQFSVGTMPHAMIACFNGDVVAATRALVRTPAFWIMLVLFGLGVSSTVGIYAMLPLYLVVERGMAPSWARNVTLSQ